MLWMLWLVPAAVASALSGWMDSRPKSERASWEMDLDSPRWPRFLVSAVLFAAIAGVSSAESSVPFWWRLAAIFAATVGPLGIASFVRKRRGR